MSYFFDVVGRSTIKRACRDFGINRWPCREEHTRNLSFGRENPQPSSDGDASSALRNVPYSSVEEEVEKVIMKVRFKEDTIKFESRMPLGVSRIFEEVGVRLNLEMGSFKLKYVDEDDDEIILTCDADLKLCPESLSATGKTFIQLLVHLISYLS